MGAKMTLGEILLNNARHNPDKSAVICKSTNTNCTYGKLNARVNQLAHALSTVGVRKGDRLAIIQHNCLQYIEIFFAAMKIGAAIVPLDHRLVTRELTYLLKDSGANTLFVGANYLDKLIDSMDSELKSVKNLFCIGPGAESMRSYNELVSSHPSAEPEVNVNEDDLATLHYTSGTTGLPKGVMMTHRNLVTAMMNLVEAIPIMPDDITLHTSPFSHIAAVWPLLVHCYAGGTNVVVDRFDPQAVLETVEENKVTTWNSVPTMIIRLIEYPDLPSYNLSSLRLVVYGAAPMPVEVLKKAILSLGNVFVQIYGSTETYIATVLPKKDHVIDGPEDRLRRLRSCGKPIGGCEVRVVNEQWKDVMPGETGEIIVRGDSVTQGYWRLPEETAKTIRQGWFCTGDLATVDEDGYIYIIDRKKEIIISGGENISPKEVEEVIYGHPSVFEVAVIGVPDQKWGEAVKAVVVLKPGKAATEDEIITFCRNSLARFKVPKSVEFTDSLPKTASGKISRKELKELYKH